MKTALLSPALSSLRREERGNPNARVTLSSGNAKREGGQRAGCEEAPGQKIDARNKSLFDLRKLDFGHRIDLPDFHRGFRPAEMRPSEKPKHNACKSHCKRQEPELCSHAAEA